MTRLTAAAAAAAATGCLRRRRCPSVIRSQETTMRGGTSLISSTGAVTSRPSTCRRQTKLSARRSSRLPLISNIWCTQMSSVIIWSPSSSTPQPLHPSPTPRSRQFAWPAVSLDISWIDRLTDWRRNLQNVGVQKERSKKIKRNGKQTVSLCRTNCREKHSIFLTLSAVCWHYTLLALLTSSARTTVTLKAVKSRDVESLFLWDSDSRTYCVTD